MSGAEFFLDTNTLVYTFDKTAPEKQAKAVQLLELALSGKGCISFQVIQEFLNLALRKFDPPMTEAQAKRYLQTTLEPLCTVFADVALYERALAARERWRFGFYDSLIVAAALDAGCSILYSEDLQHGQKIENLTVINPFMEEIQS
ncbi:MAG: PIN domain-containing protein [Thiothrix sp.]